MDGKQLPFQDYLRENHEEEDWPDVIDLIYHAYPDEGRKLIENDLLSEDEKHLMLIKWIVHSPQITCLIWGDQNSGKDAMICRVFEEVIDYCKLQGYEPPRFVTLGNIKRPWFVAPHDRYFSIRRLPVGTRHKPVYIYMSEMDAIFQARDFQGEENKLFAVLQNTFRQNHQKVFGCIKLASNVDISALRTCNLKLFKFISPEKLEIEGIERVNVLSDLGRWFLPNNREDKGKTLLAFDNNLLTCNFGLPSFWSSEYSEQYGGEGISLEDVKDYIRDGFSFKDLTPGQISKIQIAVYSLFRKNVDTDFVKSCFL